MAILRVSLWNPALARARQENLGCSLVPLCDYRSQHRANMPFARSDTACSCLQAKSCWVSFRCVKQYNSASNVRNQAEHNKFRRRLVSACLQDVLDCRRALALILRCVGVGAVLCIACEQFVGRAPGPRPGEATFACYIVHVCRTAFPMIFAKRSALKTGPRGSQPGPLPRSHRRRENNSAPPLDA